LLISLGCSQSTKRQAIEGTVTLDGAPLATGSIVFTPHSGTKGPTAGSKIDQGRFSISQAGGTFFGTFRVDITAVRKTGRKVTGHFSGQMIDEIVQFVPARYNRESELTVEVTEKGPSQFEFALKSK
jgi:hypothetical protein